MVGESEEKKEKTSQVKTLAFYPFDFVEGYWGIYLHFMILTDSF